MARKTRQSEPINAKLRAALLQEMKNLDFSLEELSEREARIQDELQNVQRERRRNQELREHARALLENRDRNDDLTLSSALASEASVVDRSSDMESSSWSLGDSKPNTSDTLSQNVYEILNKKTTVL